MVSAETILPDGEVREGFVRENLVLFAGAYYSMGWAGGADPSPSYETRFRPTDDEKLDRYGRLVVNAGRYTVRGDRLEIDPEFALVPEFVHGAGGFHWVREGNRLTLTWDRILSSDGQPDPATAAGIRWRYVLERLPDGAGETNGSGVEGGFGGGATPGARDADGSGLDEPGPLIPRAILLADAEASEARLSPAGDRLAYLAQFEGTLNLWVAPVGEPASARPLTAVKGRGIASFVWAADGRHLLYLDDSDGDENWRLHALDVTTRKTWPLTPLHDVQARLVGQSAKRPGVLVALNDRDPRTHDVYVVEIATAERRLVVGTPGLTRVVFDAEFRPRIAIRERSDGGAEFLVRGEREWEPWQSIDLADRMSTFVIGVDAPRGPRRTWATAAAVTPTPWCRSTWRPACGRSCSPIPSPTCRTTRSIRRVEPSRPSRPRTAASGGTRSPPNSRPTWRFWSTSWAVISRSSIDPTPTTSGCWRSMGRNSRPSISSSIGRRAPSERSCARVPI